MFVVFLPIPKKYARRESYSNITLVEVPEKATLYSRYIDAKYRANDILRTNNSWRLNALDFSEVEIHDIKFSHQIINKEKI